MTSFKKQLNMCLAGVLFSLVLCFCCYVPALGADNGKPAIPVEISVSGGSLPETGFTVTATPLNGAPAPEKSTVSVVLSGAEPVKTESFVFPIDTAGEYHYEIRQQAGTAPGVTYDSTVYELTIRCYKNDAGWQYVVWVTVDHIDSKPDKLSFVNAYAADTPVITTEPNGGEQTTGAGETPSQPTSAPNGGASATSANRNGDDTPQTDGETNQYAYLAWMCASIFTVLVLFAIYQMEKRVNEYY